jgi:hypothetical protein
MWDDWNKSGAGWDGIRVSLAIRPCPSQLLTGSTLPQDYVQSVSRVEMDPYPRSLHAVRSIVSAPLRS